jgi:hypothetical protein
MRAIKLAAAFGAVAASLAPACASALAHGSSHAHPQSTGAGGCQISLEVAPRPAYAGETVSAYGHLSAGCGGEEKQLVTLYRGDVGSRRSEFTAVATGASEKGSFLVKYSGITTNSLFYVSADGARSSVKQLKVIAIVKLEGPPEGSVLFTARHLGRRGPVPVHFTGEVSPEDSGAQVILQRQNAYKGNEWHRIGAVATVDEHGKFTIAHDFVVPGPANIRVVVRDPKHNLTSPSNVLNYEITQAQNPDLKIESTADPISFGQSTSIHGSVTKLATNTPLQLLAREAHTHGFSKVGEAKVQPGGVYSFASVSPSGSTFYEVTGGGETSAVLYEGVKYVLTVNLVPGTTVQEDQPLTFSGTVKPGIIAGHESIAGHDVYLERQNPNTTGFHVLEVGHVVAPVPGSTEYTYSIEHRFFGAGTQVVRIKIPGDPQNGSSVSEPFTIQVNPAPAASLTPVTPGNSSQPSEGQV